MANIPKRFMDRLRRGKTVVNPREEFVPGPHDLSASNEFGFILASSLAEDSISAAFYLITNEIPNDPNGWEFVVAKPYNTPEATPDVNAPNFFDFCPAKISIDILNGIIHLNYSASSEATGTIDFTNTFEVTPKKSFMIATSESGQQRSGYNQIAASFMQVLCNADLMEHLREIAMNKGYSVETFNDFVELARKNLLEHMRAIHSPLYL